MKVYLASYAMVTMEKIIKNEGVNFAKKRAIFIPTAGDPYENQDFVEALIALLHIQIYFSNLGQ